MTQRAALPDLEYTRFQRSLKALILSQHEQLLSKTSNWLRGTTEIEHLKLLIAKLRRMQFGRKSEKLDRQIEQLEFRLEELQTSQAENNAASQRRWQDRRQSNQPVKASPGDRCRSTCHARRASILPKQEACPDCGGELKPLGEDVSEILEYVPVRFKVIRQVRPKLACAGCDRIVQAEAPSRPIERGIAGPGTV